MRNFILSFLFLCIPCLVNAQELIQKLINVDGINYKIRYIPSSGYISEAIVVEGGDYSGNIVIPETIRIYYNYYEYFDSNVIGIEEGAFRGCSGLTSIVIPNSVTYYIGENAFQDCPHLTTVTINNNYILSDDYLYFGRLSELFGSQVETYIIGDEVTNIGNYAFSNCSSLTSIEIPNSVTSIGDDAFCNCSALTSIEIPNSVTSIGDEAFHYCNGLTSIEIPNSVTSIGDMAFGECSSLTSIVIPNSVTYIGWGAFIDCIGLKSVTSYITDVFETGNGAFEGIPDDATLYVPQGLVDTYRATEGWNRFSNIVEIGSSTSDLVDWESTNHEDNSTDSKTYEFSAEDGDVLSFDWYVSSEDGYDILTITLDGNTIVSSSGVNGETYTTPLTAGSHTLIVTYSKDSSYSANNDNAGIRNIKITGNDVPEEYIEFADANVKAICVQNWDKNHDGELSYSEASAVSDIGTVFGWSEITSFDELQYFTGLTSIGDNAFGGCSGLTSVTIPNNVSSIGGGAFSGCSSLTFITIPNSVTSIGDWAFSGCSSLTSVTIPNSVTSIEAYTFRNCSGLISIEIPGSVTSIGDETFSGCSNLTSVGIPNSVTSIGYMAFMNCSGLISIEIPNSVTSIGYYAFYGCSSLTSIEIPNSVTSVESYTFYGCSSLTSVTIPNSVTSIKNSAFRYCSGLTSVVIPNSVTSIDYYVFDGCSGLTSIEIPNSVTSIGYMAFAYCSGLKSLEIPNSVTSIDDGAFGGCSALTNIAVATDNPVYDSRDNCNAIIETSTNTLIAGCMNTVIPNSVTSIGYMAFAYCSGLKSLVIPNSVTSVGIWAFSGCSSLTNVYCYAETVPSTKVNAFNNVNLEDATLHVPACAIDDYKNTEPWSGFGSIVPLDPMEFDLTVSDAGVATLYLDFSVAIPDVEGLGDVMYVSDVVGRSLVLTKVENNIPAHTGVIVYAQPGTYTFTSSTTHVDACANSQLSGVTQDTPTADIDGTVYTLSVGKNQGDIGFRKFVGETLAANKAFFVPNESNEVNFYNFVFDDELTGINTTEQNVDDESAVIYDLQGRRVTSPSKGIYIVNGQKRIINNR